MKKYDRVMMATAKIWAEESYCKRLKVGAVLSQDGRILVTGYNGTISGAENRCEDHFWICKNCNHKSIVETHICQICNSHEITESLITSDFVLHAEQNIISFSAKRGISTEGCTLYLTHSPCKQCSKIIAQSGIKRVVYNERYRDDGLDFLNKVGVETEKLNE